MRWSNVLLLTFLLAGCATKYHEPPRSQDLAYISARAPVWIAGIDGKKVSRAGIVGEKKFAVSPGIHVLELQFSGGERYEFSDPYGRRYVSRFNFLSQSNVFLAFTAQPSRQYYVHDGRIDNRWRPFVSEERGPVFLDIMER